jgi:hypothetical protein
MMACCVSPPSTKDLLSVGFRTPEQAFATFQTAVRADDPGLEFRCFSADFRGRTEPPLSQLNYREFREVLRREHPFLRKGLVDARIESLERRGGRARLVATSHGEQLEIQLVLDDYAEVWAGGDPVVDESIDFEERTGTQAAGDGRRWIHGSSPLPEGFDAALVTELRFGREWKIDGIATVGEAATERPSAAPNP